MTDLFIYRSLISSIALNTASTDLEMGEYLTLTTTINPDDVSDNSIEWTSNNTSVAVVSAEGEVQAKSPGTAVISAEAKDGSGAKATCSIKVIPPIIKVENEKTGDEYTPDTIADYDLSSGDLTLKTTLLTVRKILQTSGAETSESGKARIVAYCLDEEPDFEDYNQVNRRKGSYYYNYDYDGRVWLQNVLSNDWFLKVNTDELADAEYLKVMIGFYADINDQEPTGWCQFGFRIRESAIPALVNHIGLNKTGVKLEVGSTATLIASVKPEDAQNKGSMQNHGG